MFYLDALSHNTFVRFQVNISDWKKKKKLVLDFQNGIIKLIIYQGSHKSRNPENIKELCGGTN